MPFLTRNSERRFAAIAPVPVQGGGNVIFLRRIDAAASLSHRTTDDQPDQFNAARGFIVSTLVSGVIWCGIGFVIWRLAA
jgi:hypothetical protein